MAKLCDYKTTETIRQATKEEQRASIEASLCDGGAGAIEAEGRKVYVETEGDDVEVIDSLLDEWCNKSNHLYNAAWSRYDTACRLANRR